jgi:hypothetical protein
MGAASPWVDRRAAPFSAHPRSGPRPQPDDLLHLLAHEILPAGEALSRWEAPEERLRAVER